MIHPFIPGLLVQAIRTAALGFALASSFTPLFSQAAEIQVERRHFQIPAGPLGTALTNFAVAADITLSFEASQTRGINSPGLNGEYPVETALAHLLAGSGLEAEHRGGGNYVLRTKTAALPSVRVEASQETTEGTGSYTTGSLATATKLPLSIRATPQSVTVITRDRMDDQGLTTASDLMKNIPGITTTATAPYRETFFSRGFAVETYLFDGLPVTANSSRRGTFLNDLAMYDRVEIVRGAAGLTQGSGTPSATMNFVRKRPTSNFQASMEGQVGSWNHLGAQADVSGPLNQGASLRGRAVVYGHDSDSFQDVVAETRQLVYLIGEVDITDNTLFTLSFSQQKNDNTTTYGGLPTALDGGDLKLPRSTFLGNKWNYWDDDTTAVFTSLEHRFDNNWKVNFTINQIWGDQEQLRAGVGWNDTTNQWDQSGGKASLENDRISYDLYAQGSFRLFDREHELVIGASKRTADEGNDTAGYWPGYVFASNIDIYNWHHDAPLPEFEVDYYFRSQEEQQGTYSTLRLNLADPLKLIMGLRLDWFELKSRSEVYEWDDTTQMRTGWTKSASGYDYDRHLTQYAGLVYDLGKQYSIYVSYTDIFKAQNNRNVDNEFIDPITGKNYEAGIKGEYFDGALNVNAAVFRIDEGNRAMAVGPCPFNGNMTCYAPTGLVRSNGYEMEIQGALTPNWQIAAGYTYATTEVRKDSNPARIGIKLNSQMPKNQFKLSTSYRFPESKWRIGGNLRWQDDVYYQWTGNNYRTEQDAYAVVDAMIGYKHSEQLDIQLNANNLFDEVYYSSINAQPVIWGGNTVYGEPRNVMLTARYKF